MRTVTRAVVIHTVAQAVMTAAPALTLLVHVLAHLLCLMTALLMVSLLHGRQSVSQHELHCCSARIERSVTVRCYWYSQLYLLRITVTLLDSLSMLGYTLDNHLYV
jgi:hypothetical protein